MRGSVKQRYRGSWSLILDLDLETDPVTGLSKRKQKWITFHGTRKQAEKKLRDLLGDADRGEFIEPSKITLGEWLTEWLDKAVAPPKRRPRTYAVYKHIIERQLKPHIGNILLQSLKPLDIEAYYAKRADLAPATLQMHQAILTSALKVAMSNNLVRRNAATQVTGKPRTRRQADDVISQCWTVDEARDFLTAAKADTPQIAAFYALAIDSGARKGELLGLKWTDINLEDATIRIVRQLIDAGTRKRRAARGTVTEPAFGPTKTGESRIINIGDETVRLLREHKRQQAELKMQNRQTYHDLGLVFAREWNDLYRCPDGLGMPLAVSVLGERTFARITKAANVRRITFHGMRHTCATLLLLAGAPIKVVQERLGHRKIAVTMDTYAHALPAMQQDAARRLGSLLHG